MCRSQLRFVPSALILLKMLLVLSACNTRSDDVAPASYPLKKGEQLNTPILISDGFQNFTGITVNTGQDKLLATLKTNRPLLITDYLNSKLYNSGIIETVKLDFLLQHTFTWNSTNRKVMMVALFRQVIKVADNRIANPEDIVWLWTPSAGASDSGKASFSNGKMATYKDGKFSLAPIPKTEPLKPDIYVWAVWAWDDKAVSIVAASRELPFRVFIEP